MVGPVYAKNSDLFSSFHFLSSTLLKYCNFTLNVTSEVLLISSVTL